MPYNKSTLTHSQWPTTPTKLVAGIFFLCLNSHVLAQNRIGQDVAVTPPTLSVPQQFTADLKKLSSRMGVTFIIEGQPIGTKSDTMSPSLQANLMQQGPAKDELVRDIAEYYDYSVVRRGNVFLFTKLYTNPNDVPDVTPEECRLAVKAASEILAPFNPHIPPEDQFTNPLATGFAQLLTPLQATTLSQDGLSIANLSAAQREEAWRLALHYYVEPQAQVAESAANFFEVFNRQDPLFHWQRIADVNAFGYEFGSTAFATTVFIPISHANKVMVAPNGTMITMSNHHTHNGVAEPDNDPTDITAEESHRVTSNVASVAITLNQAMADLNHEDKQQAHCQVDTILATKHVVIIGKAETNSSKIMNALADVYGLRVIHKEDGTLLLTRLQSLPAHDIMSLSRAVRNVTPVPLLRAFHARIKRQPLPFSQNTQSIFVPLSIGDYWEAAKSVHLAAIRQLRALAEPEVKAAKDKRLPLSKLGEQQKKLFAISLVASPLANACWLAERPIPLYIADFDHVLLTGGYYQNKEGETCFSLSLSHKDPKTGMMSRGVGFTNARLPK